MTPRLRTFIDAIESAAKKRRASELTQQEKLSLCINAGVDINIATPHAADGYDGQFIEMTTRAPVYFYHDGGNWQVIELK